jgi:hypothetical protein
VDVITLRPRPPIRALALLAVASVLGVIAYVAADAVSWGIVLRVAGVVLLVVALLLLLAVIGTMRRNRVRIEIDDRGFKVSGPGGPQRGLWEDITRVSQSASGRRITLQRRDGTVVHLVSQVEGVELARLKASLVSHLDAHRGYGPETDGLQH